MKFSNLDKQQQALLRSFGVTFDTTIQDIKPFISFIRPGHFKEIENKSACQDIFKASIEMVEIEIFSYCNRRCGFCPNSFIDRISQNQYMPEKFYKNIINDLAKIRYNKKISYSRYNEPLADEIILERLRYARRKLLDAVLHTNTNGDYLTYDYLEKLRGAGLNSLHIQAYAANNTYINEEIICLIDKKMKNLTLDYYWTAKDDDYVEAVAELSGMKVIMYGKDFSVYGCDRGGLLDRKEKPRTSPCLFPFKYFYIDYNGSVVPCCNIRSDAPEHHGFVIGNVNESSIFDIYASVAAARWRRDLFNFACKKGPCAKCAMAVYSYSWRNLVALFKRKISLLKADGMRHLNSIFTAL